MRSHRTVQIAAALIATALLFPLAGCRSVVPVSSRSQDLPNPSGPIQQRIVVIVHGDASYLYHDGDGTGHQADEETLRETFAAARAMPNAEIFVFHQRPKNALLGLFPRDDGTFYHLRGGRLLHQTTYDQDRTAPLSVEAELLRTRRSALGDSSAFTAALYYGHAVPERPRSGYHRSRPEVPFGISGLARGLGRMTGPDASAFDVVLLSTCDGGTPHTLAALAPYARYVLASPGDLHLSYVDADLLATVASTTDPALWTQRLAEQAFDRLTARTTTAVTLAAYHLDLVAPTARRMAQRVRPDSSTAPTGARHVDCRQVLDLPIDTTGVRTWHRPARFGPQADRDSHSGWGCTPRTPDSSPTSWSVSEPSRSCACHQ